MLAPEQGQVARLSRHLRHEPPCYAIRAQLGPVQALYFSRPLRVAQGLPSAVYD